MDRELRPEDENEGLGDKRSEVSMDVAEGRATHCFLNIPTSDTDILSVERSHTGEMGGRHKTGCYSDMMKGT